MNVLTGSQTELLQGERFHQWNISGYNIIFLHTHFIASLRAPATCIAFTFVLTYKQLSHEMHNEQANENLNPNQLK